MAAREAELGRRGIFQNRAGDVLQHAAVEEGGEGCVEEDGEGGGGLLDEEAVGELLGCAAAQREDSVVAGEGGGEGGGLKAAETSLAVALEELGDGGSGAVLQVGVDVEEGPADACGEDAADGGLARSHEAGEDDAAKMRRDGREGGGCGLGQGVGLGGRHGLSLV